ncbi:hypothetical protein [Mobiluncus mulieris]|uniref:Uncharacterized protein n=1 Tax=Mobiluncus mulieris TaxID=2052 RepID=A0ABD4TTL7_9ACTO|nr:hypothetical protein [Mobiluncus mulieris]MCU9968249.1 hypothetical protein [Mobiluncus mulieris]MCU9972428.1 hypothetical protein [Mobiluncus mulieris]MCV0008518.1 hypothetical protein [Mobiluncus mulieris]MCV0010627.1 hypothetical protein [Mobiluncus mulieris]NMW74425.1 hypothetical protein [Mobiluncus mulieris]
MIIQVFAVPAVASWFDGFMRGWLKSAPHDILTMQTIAVPGSVAVPGVPVLPPRHLKLDSGAEQVVVFTPEITGEPGVGDLTSLVVSKVWRHGIQPVVALATDTPLSRRQLAETGLSGVYLLAEQPNRSLEDWGKILGQTWHHD